MIELLKKNKFIILILITYIFLTLPLCLLHTPHYDEAHAWMLAKWINFSNFVDILKTEGHPILWFLILAPFAKLDIAYPYSMYLINYSFCLTAIVLMWVKAPFNKYLKLAVTFSPIFLCLFPIYARNYSIGILELFLLCTLQNKSIKHPILYASLIFVTIHTHLFFGIGAFCFALYFLFELCQQRGLKHKDFLIASSLTALGYLLFILPYVNGYGSVQSSLWAPPGLHKFIYFFSIHYGLYFLFYTLTLITFLFTKRILFSKILLFFTNTTLIIFFTKFYSGANHHFIILLVYLIVALWISEEKDTNLKKKSRLFIYTFFTILILLPLGNRFDYLKVPRANEIIKEIKNNSDYHNAKFFIDENTRFLLPYIDGVIDCYDVYTLDKFNYKTYLKRDFSYNTKNFNNSEIIYILTRSRVKENLVFTSNNYNIYITQITNMRTKHD